VVARGYTTAQLVAQELGRDLSAPQLDQVADLIEEAEDTCDHETGRSWLVASPIVNELHTATGQLLYLHKKPVTAVTSITRRLQSVGAAVSTLVAGTDYELIDAEHGIVMLAGYPYHDVVINTTTTDYGLLLSATYTSTTPVPGGIRRAVTQLVAHWMRRRLSSSASQGIRSYSVGGGDLTVTYTDVLRVFRSYRAMAFA
jgi:hypothetical protein